MVKFCTKCGKKLEENEVCSCQSQQTILGEDITKENKNSEINNNSSIPVEIDMEQIQNYFSRLFGCLISGIKKPMTTFDYLVKNQAYDLGIGLFVVSFFMTIIVAMIIARAVIGGVSLAVVSQIIPNTSQIGFEMLFKFALCSNALPMALFVFFMVIFQLVMVKKVNFKDILTICGGSHLVIIVAQILSLVGVIVPIVVFPIIIVGNCMGLLLAYSGIKQCCSLKQDKAFWLLTACTLSSILMYLYIAIEVGAEIVLNFIEYFEYFLY